MNRFVGKIAQLIFIGVTLVSCGRGDDPVSSTSGVYQQGKGWSNAEAWVCFETKGYPTEKAIIKTAVTREFNQRSPMKFLGWADCDSQWRKDVKVKFADVRSNGPFGTDAVNFWKFWDPYTPINFNIFFKNEITHCSNADERFFCIANIAVHEFGHAAGLVHEQVRHDSFCALGEDINAFGDGMVKVGSPDPLSIMSYCVDGYFWRLLPLSEGDMSTLETLYKRKRPNNAPMTNCPYMMVRGNGANIGSGYTKAGGLVDVLGYLQPGTKVNRLLTKVGPTGRTVMNVVVQEGVYRGKTYWTLGEWLTNRSMSFDCAP